MVYFGYTKVKQHGTSRTCQDNPAMRGFALLSRPRSGSSHAILHAVHLQAR